MKCSRGKGDIHLGPIVNDEDSDPQVLSAF
jgi:hypothetical protein